MTRVFTLTVLTLSAMIGLLGLKPDETNNYNFHPLLNGVCASRTRFNFWQAGDFGFGSMKKVSLINSPLTAMVDDEDYERVIQWRWRLHWSGRPTGQIRLAPNQWKIFQLHRFVMNAPDGVLVDHKFFNLLDCRKSELRFCNFSQNQQNTPAGRPKTFSKTQFKGVTNRISIMPRRPWIAQISVFKKKIYLGAFATDVEAAIAYNNAAIKYFGEFACLNQI